MNFHWRHKSTPDLSTSAGYVRRLWVHSLCVMYIRSFPLAFRRYCLCIGILGRFRARLSVHSQLIVELEALGKKVRHCGLTLWNVAVDLELPVGAHIIDGVELESISNLVCATKRTFYPTFMLYGYSSLTELPPPEFLTSSRHRFKVDS